MNILFATVDDLRVNASHNIRNASLIKCLSESGHRLFLFFNESSKPLDPSICKTLEKSSFWSNADLSYKQNSTAHNRQNFLQKIKTKFARILSKIMSYDPSVLRIRKMLKKVDFPNSIDVLITSSDPNSSHALGVKLKKKIPNSMWIQYWGDVMSEDIQYKSIKRKMASKTERKLLKKADFIVYTNPLVSDFMKAKYEAFSDKIRWIATPFSVSDSKSRDRLSEKWKIGYFGSFSNKNRDISSICQAASFLKIPMIVVGSGDLNQIDGIEIKSRCSIDELEKEEGSCNIVAVVENKYVRLSNGENGCLQIPGKLYHYANKNCYILVACEGALLKEHYDKYKRFIFCENKTSNVIECLKDIKNGLYGSYIHPVREFSDSYISNMWNSLFKKETK